ncbi:hypothetical protein protein [Bacillus cereus G9241]|nr:hypothetical protein protein [Bacillus cereus G9241]
MFFVRSIYFSISRVRGNEREGDGQDDDAAYHKQTFNDHVYASLSYDYLK